MVKSMVVDVAGTSRNIAMGRYSTWLPLVEELKADQLTVVGTINKRCSLLVTERSDRCKR